MSKARRGSLRVFALGVVAAMLIAAALAIWWRFESDMAIAGSRAAKGSTLVTTRCGQIDYQEAGSVVPLLVVHGSGGGHDQGIAFAGAMAKQGIRVIAMSRFGYLRTPMPPDPSPATQPMPMCAFSTRWAFAGPRCLAAPPGPRRRRKWRSVIPGGSTRWCSWCRWPISPARWQTLYRRHHRSLKRCWHG